MSISEELLSWLMGLVCGLLVLLIAGSFIFFKIFANRIYPGIEIDGLAVGGLTQAEARQLLEKKGPSLPFYQITLQVDDLQVASSSTELGLKRKLQPTIAQAYDIGRVGFPLKKLLTLSKTLFSPYQFETNLSYEPQHIAVLIAALANKVNLEGEAPSVQINYSGSPGSLQINPGQAGRELKTNQAFDLIADSLGQAATLSAQVASTSAILSPEQIAAARERVLPLVGKRFILKAEAVRLEITDQQLVSFFALPDGFRQQKINELINTWTDIVNRPAQNAVFDYDPETLAVHKFKPDQPGLELNKTATAELIKKHLARLSEKEVEDKNLVLALPVETTQAEKTLAETNDLGIKERIGVGDSEYDHSIPNRIHNVKITTDKINDTIIPPGEEFSFNQTLGEVSGRTGYKSAYVIKNGRTELGDGGGVCQVSTTVFRAVLDAGLKVTRRLPHSYRVSYYELNSKPGIDATVFAGPTDFRFINDTDHYVLLHGAADSENLYMKIELFGTSDGRSTEIINHKVWGYVPPPPPEYYPDPSLPAGAKKQIDWSVSGVKAKFTHIVRDKDGKIINEKTYYSNYQPWAAKYLVGE